MLRCPYWHSVNLSKTGSELFGYVSCCCQRTLLSLGREVRSWSKYLCFITRYCIIITCAVNSWTQHRHVRGGTWLKEWKMPSSFQWLAWRPDSLQSLEQPTLASVASHDHEFGVCRVTVSFLSKPEVGDGSPGNRFSVSVYVLIWSYH